jgi:hypothetical protein
MAAQGPAMVAVGLPGLVAAGGQERGGGGQPHDHVGAERGPAAGVVDGAGRRGHHRRHRRREGGEQVLGLPPVERVDTLGRRQLPAGDPAVGEQVVVAVAQRPSQAPGERSPDRRLPHRHGADQHEMAHVHGRRSYQVNGPRR